MLAQGYVLGKGALARAKAFDESHGLSATAASKVADLSDRIGLTDKFCAGVEMARSMDQRYHISDTTRSAVSATGRTAASAATAVVNSSYFSKGALWMSGALSKAAQTAAELGSRGMNKWVCSSNFREAWSPLYENGASWCSVYTFTTVASFLWA